jgi:hypothetical protein
MISAENYKNSYYYLQFLLFFKLVNIHSCVFKFWNFSTNVNCTSWWSCLYADQHFMCHSTPIHVFFFTHQEFKPNLYNSFYTCFSNKDQGFNLSKYKFRNQICTELMCKLVNIHSCVLKFWNFSTNVNCTSWWSCLYADQHFMCHSTLVCFNLNIF